MAERSTFDKQAKESAEPSATKNVLANLCPIDTIRLQKTEAERG